MPDNEPYIVGSMFGEYHSLCTLKTSIVDFRKEKELLILMQIPTPAQFSTVIIEQTIYHKSLTIFVTYTLYRVYLDIARIELAAFTVVVCTDWQCQFEKIKIKMLSV